MRSTTDYLAVLLKDVRLASLAQPGANWTDALAYGQLSSKIWLINQLVQARPSLGRVAVCAGWLGTLSLLMFYDERLQIEQINSFDLDPQCEQAARVLNQHNHGRFVSQRADAFDFDYTGYDTIINTSCDHIKPFNTWYNRVPKGKLLVLQNNNFHDADPTHTNTVQSLAEFASQAPFRTVLYQGEREYAKYTRYMLIGVR